MRQTLGKYDIFKVLGKGGMGTVFLGYDRKLHRHVAIKTIRREQLGGDDIPEEYLRRFEIEAKAIAKLNHPNIVSIHDFGEEGDVAYLVMEFVEGHDLKYYFDQDIRFNLAEVLRLMTGLLEAIAHAHEKNVWHRDIKPANIMIDTNGQIKLADFGVSRIADNNERSRIGTMVGTLNYMSPEQIRNDGVSWRADIFAAGVILYQFLTGKQPFSGEDFDVRTHIVREDPVPPSQLNSSLPLPLDAVLAKSMAKDPNQRYGSAREFIAALRQVLQEKQEPLLDMDATRHFYAAHGSKNNIDLDQFPGSGSRPASQSGGKPGSVSQTLPSEHAEIEFWRSIKDGSDIDEFHIYLARFPNGTYAALAKKRIERLGEMTGGRTGASVAGGGYSGSHGMGSHGTGSHGAGNHSTSNHSTGNHGSGAKIEPSFSDFASGAATVPPVSSGQPAPPQPVARGNWLLPAAIVLAGALVAGTFWMTRTPAPVAGQTGVSGVIGTLAPAAPPAPPASAAPVAASATAASIAAAPVAVPPAAPVATPVPTPPPAATPDPAANLAAVKALEKLRVEAAQRAREIEKLDKQKREDEAKQRALAAIAGTPRASAEVVTSNHQCPFSGSMEAQGADKTQDELCNSAKAKAEKWIASWKTPAGVAKGFDKFSQPVIGACQCQSGSCSVPISYLKPCE